MVSLSLAGSAWRFRDTSTKAWLPAVVPGCVHTDLMRAGRIPDPFYGTHELDLQWIEERDWEYESAFTVPSSLRAEEVVELVADGLDTVATVTLNGQEVARTENMFTGYRWDVKALLRPGRNRLHVRFGSAMKYIREHDGFTPPQEFNDPVGNCVRIRKQQCQFGWDWGPRFVTAGVWRDLRLEGWSGNRLSGVRIGQEHGRSGVTVSVLPEWKRPAATTGFVYTVNLSLEGKVVASLTETDVEKLRLTVSQPQLWWPAGQGPQPLYTLEFAAHRTDGSECGRTQRRIGLRTLVLDQSPDAWGKAFRIIVNGRPVFLKGANWIPAHSFVTTLQRAEYARDLEAAVAANMNCVRLWGGGIYENEDFYDLCDELGLLVWHDFMFACTLYPSDDAFLALVEAEVATQVPRIRHRASLALWCGNNELPQINGEHLRRNAALREGYEKLFHQVLERAVARHDGITPYIPSSQWRGTYEDGHVHGEREGDTHFWDVWHARHPVKDYEKWAFRFVSEFGMQSYSSPETNATFCPPADRNVFGPTMENHQKNRAGNQIILDYVSRRFRLPKDQDSLIYLSQLNQAYCMQIGVEHYRRLMPRCMGAIYWQLNDCWPVASWSSIEFTGRWKALHHVARRFNAPALVSAHAPGDEMVTIGNYRRTTVREVHLYTVYDAPVAAKGTVRWDLFHLDGRILQRGRKAVPLRPGESVRQITLDLSRPMASFGRENLYLRIALDQGGSTVSEDTVFLTPPRFLALPRGRIKVSAKVVSPGEIDLTLSSAVFQHRVWIEVPGLQPHFSDNAFELYPNEPRTLRVSLKRPISPKALVARVRTVSLVDTYT
ncbi:MAG: glycoside hydrolase family 2 protein [Opitutaceae bacterium]|nr:glycoside hydrolase family 2 protein [Opitutaceae bacterium]